MRNRAKCKLCKDIIESFHSTDTVICKCGEISVSHGNSLCCASKNWENFLRVDDEGNEIIVKTESKEKQTDSIVRHTKKDLIDMLDMMIENIERLPQNAMSQPITHYDLVSALILLSSIFKQEN